MTFDDTNKGSIPCRCEVLTRGRELSACEPYHYEIYE